MRCGSEEVLLVIGGINTNDDCGPGHKNLLRLNFKKLNEIKL